MNKKLKTILWISALFVYLAAASNAAAAQNSVQKLGRGVVNILTAPVEIPREIRAHWIKGTEKTYHVLVWSFCGLVKGTLFNTPVRLASGVWDVISAPVPIPKNFEPLLKPDTVFDDWPKRKAGVIYKNLGDP